MDYSKTADAALVAKTIEALKTHNIQAEVVDTKEAAFTRIKELIPAGAEVMTGSSTTLNEIGFTEYLKSGTHGWKNLKDALAAEKDPVKQGALRKQSVLAEYFLGSVHAVTETGETLTASGSGSQIPAYAFTSQNVIWVVGTQKIVPTMDEAFKRLKEYTFPLEDARMKATGAAGSNIGKILIMNNEASYLGRTIRLIFVNEKLGF